MKRRTFKILLWTLSPIALAAAVLLFAPGLRYRVGDPKVIQIERGDSTNYHSLQIDTAAGHFMYEWTPGLSAGYCWGSEGLSMRFNKIYFRMGTFVCAAWTADLGPIPVDRIDWE